MRTRSAVISLAAMLILGAGAVPVAAQSPSTAPGATVTPVAVPYIDADGVTHGTVTVKTIEDPFAGFDPGAPPPEGQRYVELRIVFEAAEDQSFSADPNAIVLQDTQGYLRSPAYVPRGQSPTVPDLQGQTLAPGDRISGMVGYLVPETATLASVQYVPEYSRYIPLQHLASGAAAAVGTPVTYVDGSGTTHGSVTVTELQDPFLDFDPTAPPADGQRYVLLTVVFEAAQDQAMWADPYAVMLQDSQGYLLTNQNVPRPKENVRPNLESQTMSPGDRVSGYVGFMLPADRTIASVVWSPENGRFLPLVDLGG